MINENFKSKEKEIPFFIEVLGLGIFVFLISEILFPLIFSGEGENSNKILVFVSYFIGSFISITLIRFYKKLKKSKK